jgi:hypothetical protein
MATGITSALTIPAIIAHIQPLQDFAAAHQLNLDVSLGFGLVFGISLIGCIVGTLATQPESDEIVMDFYRRVRPWGFWGPIREKVQKLDPSFEPNGDFLLDMFNVVVGIVWQVSLVALPIYLVIRQFDRVAITFGIVVVTSTILKFTWYDRLEKRELKIKAGVGTEMAAQ